jgi:hypothetical protein
MAIMAKVEEFGSSTGRNRRSHDRLNLLFPFWRVLWYVEVRYATFRWGCLCEMSWIVHRWVVLDRVSHELLLGCLSRQMITANTAPNSIVFLIIPIVAGCGRREAKKQETKNRPLSDPSFSQTSTAIVLTAGLERGKDA